MYIVLDITDDVWKVHYSHKVSYDNNDKAQYHSGDSIPIEEVYTRLFGIATINSLLGFKNFSSPIHGTLLGEMAAQDFRELLHAQYDRYTTILDFLTLGSHNHSNTG